MNNVKKNQCLTQTVEPIGITTFDATSIIDAMGKMSFSAREVARGADIYKKMLYDRRGRA
jgi:deoxyhypusine synthase